MCMGGDTARSRHGYAITYLNCPIIWKSQMQTEIALSSTESEYIGISQGLREVIPLIKILNEMKSNNMPVDPSTSKVYCRVFEDSSGALEMAKVHKFRPCTKHINVKYHHFRDHVSKGDVKLYPIRTTEQPADMLTKPLPQESFVKHRRKLMGWWYKLEYSERECQIIWDLSLYAIGNRKLQQRWIILRKFLSIKI